MNTSSMCSSRSTSEGRRSRCPVTPITSGSLASMRFPASPLSTASPIPECCSVARPGVPSSPRGWLACAEPIMRADAAHIPMAGKLRGCYAGRCRAAHFRRPRCQMRVLLLNPPFHPRFSRSQRSPARTKSGNLYYPIWLGYATAAVEQAGHTVRLIDAPAAGLSLVDVIALAGLFAPDLIAVDTSTPSIMNDLEVVDGLRAGLTRPRPFIVLTGTHASALPEETLRRAASVDAIARREFDHTLRDLASALESGLDLQGVTGLTVRQDGEIVATPDRQELKPADLDA